MLRSLLAALCALVLGAHFLRSGLVPLVAGALLLVPLSFVRRPWAGRVLQWALWLGALEWARTLWILGALRRAEGAPYLRMTCILGAVAALTALAGWLARPPRAEPPARSGEEAPPDTLALPPRP